MRWSVTNQSRTIQAGADGRPVTGYLVNVKTEDGHTDQVFVPDAEYTPERAKAIISDHLGKVDAVAGLTGEI